jgi:hypothetical protein
VERDNNGEFRAALAVRFCKQSGVCCVAVAVAVAALGRGHTHHAFVYESSPAASICNQPTFSSNLLCFMLPLIRLSFRYAGHVQNTIKFLSMAVEKALLPLTLAAALSLSISHPHQHTIFLSFIKSLTPSSNRVATTPTLRSRALRHIYPAPTPAHCHPGHVQPR